MGTRGSYPGGEATGA